MNSEPAAANSNYAKYEKEVMDLKELINSSLKFIHNVPFVIHPTAGLSVALLNPDLTLQGNSSALTWGLLLKKMSWCSAVLI